MPTSPPRPSAAPIVLALAALVPGSAALADETRAMIQWFEADRNTIEYRMPDFFIAGYGSVWLPPVSRARDLNGTGYDPFDRFDLGQPGLDQFGVTKETAFGTEEDFRAMVEQFHRASGCVYIDTIMNHNSGRDSNGTFLAEGGYPGFYVKGSNPGFWGDFNDGSTQSHDPCGANFNLFDGDLVGLIDIRIETNNWMIRNPVDPTLSEGIQPTAGDPPLNIPSGTLRNIPSADNRRFYPDLSLAPKVVDNPGFNRIAAGNICGGGVQFPATNTPAAQTLVYPFNTADPMQGDPIPENSTLYLCRWSQWMLDEMNIDGFRLDAAKHMPQWFWDEFWDVYVHDRWKMPDGSTGTPFSFVEAVSGNFEVYQEYVRKDGFANRDALDLSGGGNIRNIIGGKGASFAGDMMNGHIDPEDDGFNNGTVGVNHIHSHDNGTFGDGGSQPGVPFEDKVAPWAYSYLIMRTGPPIVYYNARQFHDTGFNRFWPREGVPIALGYGAMQTLPGPITETNEDDRITKLVQLRNRYARGFFIPRVQDSAVFIYTRQANCIVAMNDIYSTGFDSRTFSTDFAQGTRLHELTGNAMDFEVDPLDDIFDVVTVGVGGQVTIRVPRNGDVTNEHNKGYVVYGPATPSGTLTIETTAMALFPTIPPDSAAIPAHSRRLAEIAIVQDPQFKIVLGTTQTDALDPSTDDTAIFRINHGFFDHNGNGFPTFNPDNSVNLTENAGEFRAYETFTDVHSPLFGGGSGQYEQTIDGADLPEGMNYVSVIAFREGGGDNGDPLYNEWRQVIYNDQQDPDINTVPDLDCLTGTGNIRIINGDRTVTKVHAFLDLGEFDPTPPLNGSNAAIPWDRNEWLFPASGLSGPHSIRVVALEEPGGTFVRQSEYHINFTIDNVSGDVNNDGAVDVLDVYAFHALTEYECRADLDGNDVNDELDRRLLRSEVGLGEITDMTANR